jgi:hypothetical protein
MGVAARKRCAIVEEDRARRRRRPSDAAGRRRRRRGKTALSFSKETLRYNKNCSSARAFSLSLAPSLAIYE